MPSLLELLRMLQEQPSPPPNKSASPSMLVELLRQRTPVPQEGSVPQSWGEYWAGFKDNLAAQFPSYSDTPEQRQSKLYRLAMNVGPLATVYHGSPHKFSKFEMGRVGTGEGVQSYGHGLYFAENPNVARSYQNGSKESALYKVDLPDEQIGKMLDWDKPLAQQPENVRAILENLAKETNIARGFGQNSVGDILKAAIRLGLNPEARLKAIGVPGIRYLDAGSRQAGTGTHNYVVFDDNLPRIIGRE